MRLAALGLTVALATSCSKTEQRPETSPPAKPEATVPPAAPAPPAEAAPPVKKPEGEAAAPAAQPPYVPKLSEPELATLIADNNGFAFDLYRKLGAGNVAFSPASVSYALAMTYGGARGKTADEMKKALHFSTEAPKLHDGFADLLTRFAPGKDAGYQLSIANRLWGQKGMSFSPEYLDLTEKSYGAKLEPLDFVADPEAARTTINTWVEEQTAKRIKDLLAKGILTKDTRLVLTNAIYFKGSWAKTFDKNATKPGDFQTQGGTKSVPMMTRTSDEAYFEDKDVQVLALPYSGSDLAMMIVLPKDKKGLAAVETKLTNDKLASWRKGLAKEKTQIALPRFEASSDFSLSKMLTALGMKLAFTSAADFSGMTGKPDLFISAVIHKAFVKVDEEGSEAAAATAVVMTRKGPMVDETKSFVADHAFLYAILDQKTGAILFLGRVADPSK